MNGNKNKIIFNLSTIQEQTKQSYATRVNSNPSHSKDAAKRENDN